MIGTKSSSLESRANGEFSKGVGGNFGPFFIFELLSGQLFGTMWQNRSESINQSRVPQIAAT